ncbi:type II secretion system F family protein [Beduini massiliensis]|uniref:type II secretion system F family protein n=1 Tax=Beduini massiliensis TaxID=1585974 RepID=UPI00059AAA7C|nr:type II secretion system F family protein [Beduini massiliensis]
MKIMKTANLGQHYLMIETLSLFIKQQYPMHDALMMCYQLFKEPSLLKLLDELKQGKAIEEMGDLLYHDNLFKEFFIFYLYRDSLDQALIKALDLCRQKEELKHEIIKAFTYPAFLLGGVIGFSFIAVFYLQPQFKQFFSSFDIHFNFLQQCLMQLLFAFPFLLCLFFIIAGGIVIGFIKELNGQNFKELEKWFHFWLFGGVLKKYFSIKFCLYYKEFLYLGYDLHTILDMISQKIRDSHLQMIAFELTEKVKTGTELIEIIESLPYFDTHFKLVFKLSLSHPAPFTLFDQYYKTSLLLLKSTIHKIIQSVLPVLYGFIGIYIVGIYSGMILPMMNMLDKI